MADPGLHTLGRWIAEQASLAPGRAAIETPEETVSYAELDRRACALAEELVATGYRQGDRLATLTRNSADHVVAFFGAAKAGLALVPLNWRLHPDELAAQLDDAQPSLLLVDAASEPAAEQALAMAGASGGPAGSRPPCLRLGRQGVELGLHAAVGPREPPRPPRDDDALLVVYTSGSSGRPKGVVLTHSNCFWTNLSLALMVPVRPDDVVLQLLPQFHVGGWNVQPLLAWWVGATVVLEQGFDAARTLELIARRRVNVMMAVPTVYQMLSEQPGFADADLSSLRCAVVGGAATQASVAWAWRSRGVPLIQGYGLTEAGPNVLCVPPGSAGGARPYPYVEVELANPQTSQHLRGPGLGELLVRGPGVFPGYWRNPDATNAVLRDGWLHTGDLAERDVLGGYRLRGRLGDMYISGGENVHPAEVERVLLEHPAVAEAIVLGVPDRRWGEVGLAVVVVREGRRLDEAALLEHCRRHLAGFKVPGRVEFVAELPRLATGKVAKAELRATLRRRADR